MHTNYCWETATKRIFSRHWAALPINISWKSSGAQPTSLQSFSLWNFWAPWFFFVVRLFSWGIIAAKAAQDKFRILKGAFCYFIKGLLLLSELEKGEQVKAQSPRKSTRKRLHKKYLGEFDEDGENSSCPVCNFDGATLDSSLSHIREVSSCHFFKNHDT